PKMYPDRAIIAAISKAKEEYMSPDDYERVHATSFRDQQIAKIYREYQRRLKSNNALDFDDLIFQTIFLFETNPDVLAEYQERFKYIMVDEYQDTNHTQFLLVKMLAQKYRNICVVGDDDQSIYKFRGANIYNILNFEEQYPDAKVVKLEQNYRSTANILNSANHVISHNEGRKDKTLWTEAEDGEKVTFTRYSNEHAEAGGITSSIRRIRSMGGSLGEIAILYRTNAQSRVLEEKLIYDNIPYKVYGGQNFYARKEIKDIVSYMKLLVNSYDDEAVKRIINVPKRGIGATSIDKISDFAINNGVNFYDALLDIEEVPGMTRSADKIRRFTDLIEGLKEMLTEENYLSEVFDAILERTGYMDELNAEGTDEAKARIENINELRNKVVTYEENTDTPTMTELLEEIALVADVDEDEDEDGAASQKVTLMTLHSAKGLEFPYVFMTGMEDGLFPSSLSLNSDDPDALEEERRLCYVGITRAMKKLYMTAASQRMMHGSTMYCDISRFIKEIPRHYIEMNGMEGAFDRKLSSTEISNVGFGRPKINKNEYASSNPYTKASVLYQNKSALDSNNPSANPGFGKAFPMGGTGFGASSGENYKVGDNVKHLKFGKGVVTAIAPAGSDKEITVLFERVGEKRMFASLVKMKKL
ncbi:MAG: ATP-dependent helicase, partial [Wujia sp.]